MIINDLDGYYIVFDTKNWNTELDTLPNKLYGITPFALMIPLYPKVVNESVTKTFNFKERLVNVKLKDIDAWTTEHLSKNWVTERTKTLKQVS